MKIKTFIGGFDKNFSYLIWCRKSGYAAIIDPAVKPDEMIDAVLENDLKLKKILITHTHGDHTAYLKEWEKKFPNLVVQGYTQPMHLNNLEFSNLSHRQVVTIGKQLITALFTPGHYKDSICYWSQESNCIFTGDTIFVGRTGRTISTGSNISDLYNSVYKILLKLPEETLIYPGHHYGYSPTTTFSENKKYSPFFQCKSKSEFITVMENYEKSRLQGK